jgi:hypothetical protein
MSVDLSVFRPDPRHEGELNAMLDQLIAWARAQSRVCDPPNTKLKPPSSIQGDVANDGTVTHRGIGGCRL